MFLPLLSLGRLFPAVMLRCGTENLLTYNEIVGRERRERVSQNNSSGDA